MNNEMISSDKKYLFIEKDNAYPYVYTTSKEVFNVLEFSGFETREGDVVDKVFILDADDVYDDYYLFEGGLDNFPRFKHEVIDTLAIMGFEIVFLINHNNCYDGRANFERAAKKHLADI